MAAEGIPGRGRPTPLGLHGGSLGSKISGILTHTESAAASDIRRTWFDGRHRDAKLIPTHTLPANRE